MVLQFTKQPFWKIKWNAKTRKNKCTLNINKILAIEYRNDIFRWNDMNILADSEISSSKNFLLHNSL